MSRRIWLCPKWLGPLLFLLGCFCFALADRWDGVGIFSCVGAFYSFLLWKMYQRQEQ